MAMRYKRNKRGNCVVKTCSAVRKDTHPADKETRSLREEVQQLKIALNAQAIKKETSGYSPQSTALAAFGGRRTTPVFIATL